MRFQNDYLPPPHLRRHAKVGAIKRRKSFVQILELQVQTLPIGKRLVKLFEQRSQQRGIEEFEALRQCAATHPIHLQTLMNSGGLTEQFQFTQRPDVGIKKPQQQNGHDIIKIPIPIGMRVTIHGQIYGLWLPLRGYN